jgi:diketogulonate reductase-like aldo/keto reductase
MQGEGVAYEAVLRSLDELGMDYVDAYLVHWPGASGVKTEDPRNKELRMGSYRDLQKAAQEGRWWGGGRGLDRPLKEGARNCVGQAGTEMTGTILMWAGKIRHLGVSNYLVSHLQELLDDPSVTLPPRINQVGLALWSPSFRCNI